MLLIILLVIILVLIIMIILFFNKTAKMVRKAFLGNRFDDDNTLHYFTHNDFENMTQEMFDFKSNNLKLQGYKYNVSNVENKGYLVFVHGMGVGHIQYTTEIHHYCKKGYTVFTFDGQGCLNSEGQGIDYFTNYVQNLNDFLTYLESLDELKDKKIVLMGHSMGAYASGVITKFHESFIERVVLFAPFNDIEVFLKDQFIVNIKKLAYPITYFFVRQEKSNNKNNFLRISDVINQTSIKYLIVSGDNDYLVRLDHNYEFLKSKFLDNDRTYFLLVSKRGHRPNLVLEAEEYNNSKMEEFNTLRQKGSPEEIKDYYENLDYNLLVTMDKDVMDYIDTFVDGNELKDKERII